MDQRIKPHYRSEGPRQGSCGVFWGIFHTIETTIYELMDDLIIIAELAVNYVNQKHIWNQI